MERWKEGEPLHILWNYWSSQPLCVETSLFVEFVEPRLEEALTGRSFIRELMDVLRHGSVS